MVVFHNERIAFFGMHIVTCHVAPHKEGEVGL